MLGAMTNNPFASHSLEGINGAILTISPCQRCPMNNLISQLQQSQQLGNKVSNLLRKRLSVARQRFSEQLAGPAPSLLKTLSPRMNPVAAWLEYSTDALQRSILFWDTLRQRGNNALDHEQAGKPPLLHFAYEMVMDGRTFSRAVNYALVRILPPDGVTVDNRRRPYIIIDPRAGHGPGIGGFKDDSQVGVALQDGHPVYFVIFFPEPEPGQTLQDVCAAEQQFVKKVRQLHPDSAKPAVLGNCQGGWAAMMLAAADPRETGVVVINGAPMSYWSGALSEGEGDNPMRYSGGMLGGSWLASMSADLGDGIFDGAHLVQNFENLNPANTFWEKYYNLYARIDTEPARFLEFERWWSGYYLMNKEEIEWIVQNLFVGNSVWDGAAENRQGRAIDLRDIKAPIVVFASMGDNITPPQQAFNWVADTYRSTDEIKANGQTIVGLLHEDIGHLGIFVSGKVAKREHSQIVSVLKSIESLPPGLFGMKIDEQTDSDGNVTYDVTLREHRLEDVVARLNRVDRADEKPFEAVKVISDFNQRAYELFVQPLVQAMSSAVTARRLREWHPLRLQYRLVSDRNPFLAWLKPAAALVKANRRPVGQENPFLAAEKQMSKVISASLDLYRDVNNALTETLFFQTYGTIYIHYLAARKTAGKPGADRPESSREAAESESATPAAAIMADMASGGYAFAVARLGALLAEKDRPLPLDTLHLKHELVADYHDLLPEQTPDETRRLRGRQDILVSQDRDRAISTLPDLLQNPADRKRFVSLLERLQSDPRLAEAQPSQNQLSLLAALRELLQPVRAAKSKGVEA